MAREGVSRTAFWMLAAVVAGVAAATHLVNAAGYPAVTGEEASLLGRAQTNVESDEWYSPGFEWREPFGATWFVVQLFSHADQSWDSARTLAAALAVGDAVLLYLVAARLTGRPVAGAGAGLAFALTEPGFTEFRRLTIPAFGVFFTLLALALLLSDLPARVLLAGLAYGAALFADLFALVGLPAVALLLAREFRGRPIPLASFSALALGLALLWPLRASFDSEIPDWWEGLGKALDGPGFDALGELVSSTPLLVLTGIGCAAYLSVREREHLPSVWLAGGILVLALLNPIEESEAWNLAPAFALAVGAAGAALALLAAEAAKRAIESSPDATPLGASGAATVQGVVVVGLLLPAMFVGGAGVPPFWVDHNADLMAATDFIAQQANDGDVVVAGPVAKPGLRAHGLKVYDWYRADLEEKNPRFLLMDENARWDLRSWPGLKAVHDASTPLATFGKYEVRAVAATGSPAE